MTILDRLAESLLGRREASCHDLTGGNSIAICNLLRAAGGGMPERREPEPCPICGRGTVGGHQHSKSTAGVVPIRKAGGG